MSDLKAIHEYEIALAALRLGDEEVDERLDLGPEDLADSGIRVHGYGFETSLVLLHQGFEPSLHDRCDEVGFRLEVIAERADRQTCGSLDRAHRNGTDPMRREEVFGAVEEMFSM
jgi:hypothetical protein